MPSFHSRAWRWVPSLYFAEGVPYAIVGTVSAVLLKNLDMSNRELAVWTSLLTFPWVIKPLWAPLLDLFSTKKHWFVVMQVLMGAGFAAAALMLPFRLSDRLLIAVLMLIALASATHDVAADGFYLIGLDAHEQAWFTGMRSTAYRIATVTAQGLLVMLVGMLQEYTGDIRTAWMIGLLAAGILMGGLALWHGRMTPAVEDAAAHPGWREVIAGFGAAFAAFFRKKYVGRALAFLLLYRLGESQLVRLAAPFMLDGREAGGMGLNNVQQGFIYGTVGVLCLLAGGILGGMVIARDGIRRWLWPMALAINLPDLVYVYLAWRMPESLWTVGAAVAVEQFGYGFGFTLYMLFMVAFAEDSGRFKTSHFALMTGFMALGMMVPGMVSGDIQSRIGNYLGFFWYVMACTLPSFGVVALVAKVIPADFGCKARSGTEAQ